MGVKWPQGPGRLAIPAACGMRRAEPPLAHTLRQFVVQTMVPTLNSDDSIRCEWMDQVGDLVKRVTWASPRERFRGIRRTIWVCGPESRARYRLESKGLGQCGCFAKHPRDRGIIELYVLPDFDVVPGSRPVTALIYEFSCTLGAETARRRRIPGCWIQS